MYMTKNTVQEEEWVANADEKEITEEILEENNILYGNSRWG